MEQKNSSELIWADQGRKVSPQEWVLLDSRILTGMNWRFAKPSEYPKLSKSLDHCSIETHLDLGDR